MGVYCSVLQRGKAIVILYVVIITITTTTIIIIIIIIIIIMSYRFADRCQQTCVTYTIAVCTVKNF